MNLFLANALERAAILAEDNAILGEDLRLSVTLPAGGPGGQTLEEPERAAVLRALEEVGGHRRKAAERLGIGERTLSEKLTRYGLT